VNRLRGKVMATNIRRLAVALVLLAVPLTVEAQQAAVPVVGFLRSTPSQPFLHLVTAFGQGLKEAGFVEGQNVAIEYRYADNHLDRLPGLVADLIRRQVAVIVCNQVAAAAAKTATATVPIVFVTGGDPGSVGPSYQPQPAGRQPHGHDVLRWRPARREAGGAPA
jgi:ABC-type uncharacterized transport system substrate-binding protein